MIALEFTSVAELRQHYADLAARLWTPPPRPMLQLCGPVGKPLEEPDLAGNFLHLSGMAFIAAYVAAKTGVSVREIRGRSRAHLITRARQEVAALSYLHCPVSLPKIGKYLQIDHSSVSHARSRYVARTPGAAALEIANKLEREQARTSLDRWIWGQWRSGILLTRIAEQENVSFARVQAGIDRIEAERAGEANSPA